MKRIVKIYGKNTRKRTFFFYISPDESSFLVSFDVNERREAVIVWASTLRVNYGYDLKVVSLNPY
jgi:hypothetical protein